MFSQDLKEEMFPELKESEDERIRKALIKFHKSTIDVDGIKGEDVLAWLEAQGAKVSAIEGFETEFEKQVSYLIASAINKEHEYNQGYVKWTANALLNYAKHELEKQGSEPNWCHHKVDLSNCTEEYRKAYYDGWNNCNQQHSQCKSESNDVVKCLINGMKFYYEGNEEATWGTEKFSMKIKDILSWLEKQEGKHKTEPQSRWWPSEEQMDALADALSLAKSCGEERAFDLRTLYEQLKKLTE
jgi:hypothetical protein